jgi:hypothetical protein
MVTMAEGRRKARLTWTSAQPTCHIQYSECIVREVGSTVTGRINVALDLAT